MKIEIEKFEIECFEQEFEMKQFLNDHKDDSEITERVIYSGKLYGIPKDIKDLFRKNLLVQIKKINYNDVQAIIILK